MRIFFERHGEAQAVKDAGLPVSPTFAEFIEHFDLYRQLSRPVRRHTQSYTRYLGDSLAWFDRIFRIEKMRELEAYLTERAGFEITIPKENRSSKKRKATALGTNAIKRLREITQKEYDLVDDYYSFDVAIETLTE